jgi:D-psicose/D-tagatose/L-ribulose 3-epimerase
MKIGVSTVLFVFPFTNKEIQLFESLKDWGYDSVELLICNTSDIDPIFIKKELDKHGLACSSVCGAMNPYRDLRGSSESQKNGVKFLCDLLDMMVELNCPLLGGPMYSYVGKKSLRTPEQKIEEWDLVRYNLKKVVEHAEKLGKRISIEPINRWETDFMTTIAEGLQMIKDVESPALGVHLDTHHANIEEKSIEQAILMAGKHLTHIHASACDRGTVGSDHMDWGEINRTLQAIDYQGDVVIESLSPDIIPIAAGACLWRPTESTQDMAVSGLKHLRKTLT